LTCAAPGSRGLGTVTGGTRNFAVVDPEDDSRAIYYAALEGPEAGTNIRGSGRTGGGEATAALPSYFTKVTEVEGVTVQLTPVGGWSRLYVVEQGAGRLVVRVADGDPDVAFNYQVQGVRKGSATSRWSAPTRCPCRRAD
jgi:hypothetical protein